MPAIAELSVTDWRRLNRLLEQALGLEAAERTTWLRSLPADELDLKPLLAQLLAPRDLTETAQFAAPLPGLADAAGLGEQGRSADEQPGQLIGPYQLLRELGQGGMGTVWLAERADGAFERQAALKLPRAEWTDRGLAQRFARERAVLASLNHPNIAQLFDAGWSESGRPYLALEYVDGQSILAWSKQRNLDVRARLRLFIGVIRAVAHAHARLIVHRDLKPTNVLVTAEGQVKLLDFGIAKLLTGDTTAAEETELTRLAGRPLTPSYAAPEQILGQPISTAADIYALGVMLFELLTGERPYRLPRESRGALEEAIVRVDPPAPSSVVRSRVARRPLRGDLDAIALKALQKNPERRYETAAAFADDIERHLERLPVRAQRASRTYRLSRFIARNRLAVGATAGVIAALAVGLSVALWQARIARNEAARANTIKDFVLSIIQQADPVASRQTKEADIALLAAAESRIDKELAGQPEVALQMHRAIGAAYRNRGEFRRAGEVLRKAIGQARTRLPPHNLELLAAQVQMGDELVIGDRQAKDDLDAAIATLRRLGTHAEPLLVDALRTRYLLQSTVDEDHARDGHEALRIAQRLPVGSEEKALQAAADIVSILIDQGRIAEALETIEPSYRRAVATGRLERSDPRLIVGMSWYGRTLTRVERIAEGVRITEEAVAAARRHHGPDAHATGVAIENFGHALNAAGYAERAFESLKEAYAIAVKREPANSPGRLMRRNVLMFALLNRGKLDEALQVLEETPFPETGAGVGSAGAMRSPLVHRWQEAAVRGRLGDTVAAEQLFEGLIADLDKAAMSGLANAARVELALALLQNDKAKQAEPLLAEALAHERSTAPRSENVPRFLRAMAEAQLANAQYQHALSLIDEVQALLIESGMPALRAASSVRFLRGRTLLGMGRHMEALETLATTDANARKGNAEPIAAARVFHWHGLALIANGELARGRALIAEARPLLVASRFPGDRRLADGVHDRPAGK